MTPAYFAAVRMPMVRGRVFTTADREDSGPVGDRQRLDGAQVLAGRGSDRPACESAGGTWVTVVGISGDIIQDWFLRRNEPTLYRPMAQSPSDYFSILVRTAGDPAGAAGAIRKALLRVDPNQPVFDLMTMRRSLHERTIGLQYLAAIMAIFAVLALVLAAVGLYAVIAYLRRAAAP